MREEVLEYLDAEMLSALRAREGREEIAERVRGRLDRLRPYMTVEEVGVTVRGSSVEGRVRGRYRGPLIGVAAHLAGGAVEGIPLEVLSFARRPRSAAQVRSEWEGKELRGWRRTMGDPPGAFACIFAVWSKGGGRLRWPRCCR
jgi:hypothetical protein